MWKLLTGIISDVLYEFIVESDSSAESAIRAERLQEEKSRD